MESAVGASGSVTDAVTRAGQQIAQTYDAANRRCQPIAGDLPAILHNSSGCSFSRTATSSNRQCLHLPSERLNTRATHIQCCPFNLGKSDAVTERLPAKRLEARLLPAMSVVFMGSCLPRRQLLFGGGWPRLKWGGMRV